jgi:serine/threonine-protein kinase
MALEPRALIAQRYELSRLIGEGGMGSVWAATHLVTNKLVALKFLTGPASDELTRRFVREAKAASAVRHPNVIQVHDVITMEDGRLAMVMDLLEGESLGQRLHRLGPFSWQTLAAVMVPVFSGVGAVHAAGIVHRDLKPDNVFLSQLADGRVQPIVLDFGICKLGTADGFAGENTALTATGLMVGTPFYMAPEQMFGETTIDARTDVWALGVIMYECATGQRPVQGENLGQLLNVIANNKIVPVEKLAPSYPPAFAELINRMLTRDRNERPADLREAFATLSQLASVSAPGFDPPPTLAPDSSFSSISARSPIAVDLGSLGRGTGRTGTRRGPSVGILVSLVVAGLIVAGAGTWWLRSRSAGTATSASAQRATAPKETSPAAPSAGPGAPSTAAVPQAPPPAQMRPAPAGPRAGGGSTKSRGGGKLAGGVQGAVPF